MLAEIPPAPFAMSRTPRACINADRSTALVNDRVNAEARIDHRGDAFAFLVYRVAIQQTGADARASSASFEIERQHVCGFDRARRSESWTYRLATAREA